MARIFPPWRAGSRWFDDAIKHFGRADILVNNAGILLDQTFAKATEAAWDKVLKVHLKGTFCVSRRCSAGCGRTAAASRQYVVDVGLIGNFGQTITAPPRRHLGLSNVLAVEGRNTTSGFGRWRRAR